MLKFAAKFGSLRRVQLRLKITKGISTNTSCDFCCAVLTSTKQQQWGQLRGLATERIYKSLNIATHTGTPKVALTSHLFTVCVSSTIVAILVCVVSGSHLLLLFATLVANSSKVLRLIQGEFASLSFSALRFPLRLISFLLYCRRIGRVCSFSFRFASVVAFCMACCHGGISSKVLCYVLLSQVFEKHR